MYHYLSRLPETILEDKRITFKRPVTIRKPYNTVTPVLGLNALETILEGSEGK